MTRYTHQTQESQKCLLGIVLVPTELEALLAEKIVFQLSKS